MPAIGNIDPRANIVDRDRAAEILFFRAIGKSGERRHCYPARRAAIQHGQRRGELTDQIPPRVHRMENDLARP